MLLLVLSSLAYALTCDEVAKMVDVGVPESIIVQTLHDAGPLDPDDVACLEKRNIAAPILAAAKGDDDQPTASPPPMPPTPPTLPALPPPPGISQALLKHPKKATEALIALTNWENAGDRQLVEVWLGRELLAMGLVHSAGHPFEEAVRLGTSGAGFYNAWDGLVTVADKTGDSSDLAVLIQTVPRDALFPSAQSQAAWLAARALFEEGKLTEALAAVDAVFPGATFYPQAQFLEGVIYAKEGKLKSSTKAFRDVYRTPAAADTLKELALLNIARIYYEIERYDQTTKYLALLPPESPQHVEGLFEQTWAAFMMNHLAEGTLNLATLKAEAKDRWLPEVPLLSGLYLYNELRFGEIDGALADLDALKPVEAALTDAILPYANPSSSPPVGDLYKAWLAPGAKPPVPAPLLDALKQDTEVQGLLSHLALLDTEEHLIAQQSAAWRKAVGDGLLPVIASDRATLKGRAEQILVRRMAQREQQLRDLLWQSQILHFEAADAVHSADALPRLQALLADSSGEENARIRIRLAGEFTPDPHEKIAAYEKIFSDFPQLTRSAEATYDLAAAQMRIGERDAAVALLRDMVTTWPKDEATLEGLQLLGDDAFARKDLSNARADFEASLLSHDPQTKIYAHYRLAWCSWAEGHHPDAITQMSAVAADNSDPTLAKRAAEDLGRMRADGAPRR